MEPQGQEGHLDGGQYDTADSNLLLTLFGEIGECRSSYGLMQHKRVARVPWKGSKSLPFSVTYLLLSFNKFFCLVGILGLGGMTYPAF